MGASQSHPMKRGYPKRVWRESGRNAVYQRYGAVKGKYWNHYGLNFWEEMHILVEDL